MALAVFQPECPDQWYLPGLRGAHHHDRKQRGIQARRSVASRGRGRSYPRVFGRPTLVGRSGRTPIHRVVCRPRNMVGTDRHLCNRRASCRAGAVLFLRGRHVLSAAPPTLHLGWLRCRVPGPRPACRPLCPGRPKRVDHVGSELQSQRSDVRAWIAGGPDDWWLDPLWSLVRIRPHAVSQKRACWTAAHLTQRWRCPLPTPSRPSPRRLQVRWRDRERLGPPPTA